LMALFCFEGCARGKTSGRSLRGIGGEPGFELGQGFGHIAAAITKADVTGLVIDSARKEEDTGFADEAFAERLHVLRGLEAGEPDGSGVGKSPIEEAGMPREESGQQGEIAEDDLEAAVNQFLAMAEGDGSEEFARGAGADGGVVLEGDDLLKDGGIAAGEPAEAKSGEAVGLADRGEAEGALIQIAGSGEARGRVVLEFAINLIGENVNTLAGGEFQDAVEDMRRHEEARGIVR